MGSLFYLRATRPDIAYAVGMVSIFMAEDHLQHWKATKRILGYIKGPYQLGLDYQYGGKVQLAQYTDSDWGQGMLKTEDQLLDMFCRLIREKFHGVVRNKLQFLYHQQKLNINVQLLQHKKLHA